MTLCQSESGSQEALLRNGARLPDPQAPSACWTTRHVRPRHPRRPAGGPPAAAGDSRWSLAEESSASQWSPASLLLYAAVWQMVTVPVMESWGCVARRERPVSSVSSVTLGSSLDPSAVVAPSVRCTGRASLSRGHCKSPTGDHEQTHWEVHGARQQVETSGLEGSLESVFF